MGVIGQVLWYSTRALDAVTKAKIEQNVALRQNIENCRRIIKANSNRPDLMEVTYSRSGGPGGQHVNKVSSKVTFKITPNGLYKLRGLLFDETLFDNWITKITEYPYYTKSGNVVVHSELTRERERNLDDCIRKVLDSFKKYSDYEKLMKTTQDEIDQTEKKWKEINKKANEKRLKEKKFNQLKKQSRKIDLY